MAQPEKPKPKSDEERYRDTLDFLWRQERQWAPIHRIVDEEVGFIIDGLHYDDDQVRLLERSSRFIRWVGPETFNAWDQEVAQTTSLKGPMHARPVDEHGDADTGEIAAQLVTDEIERPDKEFEDVMEDVVGSASACGYGVALLEFLPDVGEWGEILAVPKDPRHFGWDQTCKSIHSPKCRFIWWRFRMTVREAESRAQAGDWNKALIGQLKPDEGPSVERLGDLRSAPFIPLTIRDSGPTLDTQTDLDEFTGYVIMYRNADDYAEKTVGYNDLPEDERFMRCASCGYRTELQGKLAQQLPDVLEGGCPECQGDLHRVDGADQVATTLAYPRGKMCIVAPYSGFNQHLFEDGWQFQTRSFPAMMLSRWRHPWCAVGPSLASKNGWNQIATDMVMRVGLERLVQSASYWRMPIDGYVDDRNQPFTMSDENGTVMFYDADTPPGVVDMIDGAQVPGAWSGVYQTASSVLNATLKSADWNLAPDQSHDIPASSVALQVHQQEVPLKHYQKRYMRQRGLFLGVYYDMIRATYTMERIYRLRGPDGLDTVRALAAADMPNFDFYLSDSPDVSPTSEADQKAVETLIQAIQSAPWAVDLIAQVNNFSPALVRKAKQSFATFQQEQAQAQAAAVLPTQGGAVPQSGGSLASLLQGLGPMTQPAGV